MERLNWMAAFKKVELQSFNGNIDCTVTEPSCERIEAKVTTGGIKLFVPEHAAIAGELKTNLGNFNIDYTGIQVTEEKMKSFKNNFVSSLAATMVT